MILFPGNIDVWIIGCEWARQDVTLALSIFTGMQIHIIQHIDKANIIGNLGFI